MRQLLVLICLGFLAVSIAGCGAHSSQSINTDGDGSLLGVRTVPADGRYDVRATTSIRVYWVEGYEPPAQFTFRLRDEDRNSVYTTYKALHDPEQWVFEPYGGLEYNTFYTIEIAAGNSRRYFVFETEPEPFFFSDPESGNEPHDPEPGDSKPQAEHMVVTGR